MQRRLLCVDDEESIRITMAAILTKHGFEVTVAATVAEALQKITSETFDVLLSDLNIGNPGDGLTVVSAMRRTQPQAVTMILTGFPAFETALEAIRQQVDDYIVKPADIPVLVETIERKLAAAPEHRKLPPPERVAMVLQAHLPRIEELWIAGVEEDDSLSEAESRREQRLKFVRRVLETVVCSAQSYSGEETTPVRPSVTSDASPHAWEGYTPNRMLTEFCVLRRILAQIVQENLLAVNLSYVVPDLARINETLDEEAQALFEQWL